ncbi:hypothetical protein K3495_g9012 [Podosphaera aphanis]|nr:hypothetical protein K3495_g9012 [Podosphaera aphanis]
MSSTSSSFSSTIEMPTSPLFGQREVLAAVAANSHSQSRNSSRCSHNLKSLSAERPKLMRATATAPSLQTSIIPREAQYSHSTTRAAALLSRMANSGASLRQTRGGSIGSLDSSCYSSSEEQSPTSTRDDVTRKESYVRCSNHSGNYFSFPNFEDFEDSQEEG